MAEYESEIGRKVAYYRARKGLSQRDFAPLIQRSEAWVSQVERGVRPVKALDILERIATVLEIPVAELAPSAPAARAEQSPAHTVALRLLLTGNHALRAVAAAAASAPDLDQLAERVEFAWTFTRQARYAELHALLESLLPELEAVAAHADSAAADDLLADVYQVWAVALAELDQWDAAWVAAERAMGKARRGGDPILMAACAFRLTMIFQRSRQLDLARHTVDTARQALEPHLGRSAPRALTVYGALTLQSATIAARSEDAERAQDMLVRAREVADDLGADREECRTEFGPRAVDLCEVAVAVELGDAGIAIRSAGKIDRQNLSDLHRVRLLVDTARAWAQRRSPERALALLLEAETLAPEHIYRQRSVRSTTADLLSMDPSTPGLGEFAQRTGVDAMIPPPSGGRSAPPRSGLRSARGPRTI